MTDSRLSGKSTGLNLNTLSDVLSPCLQSASTVFMEVKILEGRIQGAQSATYFLFICENFFHIRNILERGSSIELVKEQFVLPCRYVLRQVTPQLVSLR